MCGFFFVHLKPSPTASWNQMFFKKQPNRQILPGETVRGNQCRGLQIPSSKIVQAGFRLCSESLSHRVLPSCHCLTRLCPQADEQLLSHWHSLAGSAPTICDSESEAASAQAAQLGTAVPVDVLCTTTRSPPLCRPTSTPCPQHVAPDTGSSHTAGEPQQHSEHTHSPGQGHMCCHSVDNESQRCELGPHRFLPRFFRCDLEGPPLNPCAGTASPRRRRACPMARRRRQGDSSPQ